MLPVMDYVRLGVLAVAVFGAVLVTHKVDLASYRALELKTEKDKRAAMEWGLTKQKEYDDAAIKSATKFAQAESDRADAAERRAAAVPAPTVLVRGCLTYEFVRTLDAAITNRPVSALLLPAGKRNDACAPVDAAVVVRWVLGIIDVAQHNATQLDALIAGIRNAQALR